MVRNSRNLFCLGLAMLAIGACAESPSGPAEPVAMPAMDEPGPVADVEDRPDEDVSPPAPVPPEPAGAPNMPGAIALQITTYDDGRSCPGNCDAHVVFHNSLNGGPNAYAPAAGTDPLAARPAGMDPARKCQRNSGCVVCFDRSGSSCILVTYRGSGPPAGKVDVTPAFMKAWCDRPGIPAALETKCRSHMAAAEQLAARTNCIAEPEHEDCLETMTRVRLAKEEDTPRYEQCVAMGQTAYNNAQADPLDQREHSCTYYKNRRHSSDRWILLTPGACRDGYFVGRDGLDCCSADPVQAAIDPRECGIYYR